MDQSILGLLQTCPIFNDLREEQLQYLIRHHMMAIATYKRNEIIFWTDSFPGKLYLLISGGIAMGRDTASGKRSLSKTNNVPGDLIGTVLLFSSKKLLWDYAVALEDCSVVEIESRLFTQRDAVEADIQLVLLRNMIGNIVDRIDYLGQKVLILSEKSVRKRIACYLSHIQDKKECIILHSTREEIADYLGIARPSLSRELGRMQDDGIIQLDGNKVYIINHTVFDELID